MIHLNFYLIFIFFLGKLSIKRYFDWVLSLSDMALAKHLPDFCWLT